MLLCCTAHRQSSIPSNDFARRTILWPLQKGVKIMNPNNEEVIRELDMTELDSVNGGMLPAVFSNIIAKIACEVHGGDYYSDGTASVCAGPQG
jgi:hypothetical protein